jgi:heme exporter protein B
MPPTGSTWLAEALAVFWKDALTELRGRESLTATLLFAVTALFIVALAVPAGLKDPALLAALFWIVLFFSISSGALRVFVKEEDARTALALRLAARPTAVLGGKMLFNGALGLALAAITGLLFTVMTLRTTLPAHPGLFAASALLGGAGIAAGSTIVAAIVSRASVRGPLFTVLAFPILLPLFIPALHLTLLSLSPSDSAVWADPAAARNDLVALLSYLVAVVTASGLLFDAVWID